MKKISEPVWEVVVSCDDIKYKYFSLAELHDWIKKYVPADTKEEDIRLEVIVDQSYGYYDEVIIDAKMELSVLRKS